MNCNKSKQQCERTRQLEAPNICLPTMSEGRTISLRKSTDMTALAGKWKNNPVKSVAHQRPLHNYISTLYIKNNKMVHLIESQHNINLNCRIKAISVRLLMTTDLFSVVFYNLIFRTDFNAKCLIMNLIQIQITVTSMVLKSDCSSVYTIIG